MKCTGISFCLHLLFLMRCSLHFVRFIHFYYVKINFLTRLPIHKLLPRYEFEPIRDRFLFPNKISYVYGFDFSFTTLETVFNYIAPKNFDFVFSFARRIFLRQRKKCTWIFPFSSFFFFLTTLAHSIQFISFGLFLLRSENENTFFFFFLIHTNTEIKQNSIDTNLEFDRNVQNIRIDLSFDGFLLISFEFSVWWKWLKIYITEIFGYYELYRVSTAIF